VNKIMKALTAQQMRDIDRLTSDPFGIPSLQLMENAGEAITESIVQRYPDLKNQCVTMLCGKGNNGGDGFVIARRLKEAAVSPNVIVFGDPSAVRGDAATNLKSWQQIGELRVVKSEGEWEAVRDGVAQSDLIVDALLGTGLKGPVEGLLARVIDDVNAMRAHSRELCSSHRLEIVAVDMPSGLASDGDDFGGPIINADLTVTLTAPKVGQLISPRADCVGKLVVREIGTPASVLKEDESPKLHWLEPREFRSLPLIRHRDAHKGTFGHALVAAGSVGKTGAAIMSGRAALRAGAGLVTIATPPDALAIVAAGAPEFMTTPFVAASEIAGQGAFASVAKDKSVLALGPGLGTALETQSWVRSVVAHSSLPLILDADALNAFAGRADELKSRKAHFLALTPHPGEMARLLGLRSSDVQSRRRQIACEMAARWNAFVILKGFHTVLATPDGRAFVNTTGNAGMAKGGTGDVLTGLLAGLTAEFGTKNWERVLGLGIYLHGLAADIVSERVGEIAMLASDIIDSIPAAFEHLIGRPSHVHAQGPPTSPVKGSVGMKIGAAHVPGEGSVGIKK
jgi:hydroxyethylthiazole kinase-like uncharacterized protein yjeF